MLKRASVETDEMNFYTTLMQTVLLLCPSVLVYAAHAKLEREYQTYRDWDKKTSENALKDAELFGDMATSLSM